MLLCTLQVIPMYVNFISLTLNKRKKAIPQSSYCYSKEFKRIQRHALFFIVNQAFFYKKGFYYSVINS